MMMKRKKKMMMIVWIICLFFILLCCICCDNKCSIYFLFHSHVHTRAIHKMNHSWRKTAIATTETVATILRCLRITLTHNLQQESQSVARTLPIASTSSSTSSPSASSSNEQNLSTQELLHSLISMYATRIYNRFRFPMLQDSSLMPLPAFSAGNLQSNKLNPTTYCECEISS